MTHGVRQSRTSHELDSGGVIRYVYSMQCALHVVCMFVYRSHFKCFHATFKLEELKVLNCDSGVFVLV